jgi:hypothetical protein
VQKQRLLKLAKFLRTKVDDNQFDMGIWATKKQKSKCLTAGCALGWATVCFPRSKLKQVRLVGCHVQYAYAVVYDEMFNHGAARSFFDLGQEQVVYLFAPASASDPYYDATPKQVAERIEKFVESNGTIPDGPFKSEPSEPELLPD